MYILASFVKDKVSIGAWIYLWAFYFVPLIYVSVFVPVKLNIQKTNIMASGLITSCKIDGETVETVSDFIFGAPKSLHMVTAAMKLKNAYSLEGKL